MTARHLHGHWDTVQIHLFTVPNVKWTSNTWGKSVPRHDFCTAPFSYLACLQDQKCLKPTFNSDVNFSFLALNDSFWTWEKGRFSHTARNDSQSLLFKATWKGQSHKVWTSGVWFLFALDFLDPAQCDKIYATPHPRYLSSSNSEKNKLLMVPKRRSTLWTL